MPGPRSNKCFPFFGGRVGFAVMGLALAGEPMSAASEPLQAVFDANSREVRLSVARLDAGEHELRLTTAGIRELELGRAQRSSIWRCWKNWHSATGKRDERQECGGGIF